MKWCQRTDLGCLSKVNIRVQESGIRGTATCSQESYPVTVPTPLGELGRDARACLGTDDCFAILYAVLESLERLLLSEFRVPWYRLAELARAL